MNIGEYIKQKRIDSNITQEELAEIVGVSDRTIRRIENEAQPKENETLKEIYKVLGISTTAKQLFLDMLKFDNEMNHLNPIGLLSKLNSQGPQDGAWHPVFFT